MGGRRYLTIQQICDKYGICYDTARKHYAKAIVHITGDRRLLFDAQAVGVIRAAQARRSDDGRGLPRRRLTAQDINDYNRRCPFDRATLERFLRLLADHLVENQK